MCNPEPPANSPLAELMISESQLLALTPDTDWQVIANQFDQFKEKLWQLIEIAPDTAPYTHSWNLVNLLGKADMLDFEQGNTDALARVQDKVREAMANLP